MRLPCSFSGAKTSMVIPLPGRMKFNPRDVPIHIVGRRRPIIEASRQSPPAVLTAQDDLTNAVSHLGGEWLRVIGRQPKAGGVLHEITCSKISEPMED